MDDLKKAIERDERTKEQVRAMKCFSPDCENEASPTSELGLCFFCGLY